ncbi:protein phosphatase CheZ [Gallionella capsiferriformans]|uniref:Protein phosphatase CheZ n=1 Tax=Gallionella capsiferriformans (strain ES-2) TaxID=395494 RepID=D9SER7_GALCS|nr:protein phosphatase CheZ [Gallionella capsiferriformans]ADL55014.1 chemotaxis phosphatase, CheZ [Gallionella capsiferriformans ES-2]
MTTKKESDDDLELLFESILAKNTPEKSVDGSEIVACNMVGKEIADQDRMINQLGKITRTLHDTLRELGLNKQIERVTSSIPDARDRLNYVATLTQQAAERVLNATEAAQPLVQNLEIEALHLDAQWQKMFAGELSSDAFKSLIMRNKVFLQNIPNKTTMANGYLMEIMMAQDFQDLTGQVIKKIIDLTQNMEKQLLALLLEQAPVDVKAELDACLLNGPVINSNGRNVVTSQDEVDDLLGSLGF